MSDNNDKALKTENYASESAEDNRTRTYDSGEGRRTDRTTTHQLGVGDDVELRGQAHRIERIISGENATAEAVIYLIRGPDDEDCCLKLYYPFRNPQDEPNPEALKRIQAIKNPDILRLHIAGTGPDKFRGQFCYEVCDFAEGGDLLSVEDLGQQYTPEFLEEKVIPQIFKGIKVLHKHRIYHCDLKPQNVFYLDADRTNLVIGDYGSAKTFEQSTEKELAYVSMVKGTEFYLAPEQAIGIISEKNDYYSLGMIVLHLLYPELMDRQTLRRIYERRALHKPIIDYKPRFKRLNDLIAGLTLQDIQRRWGEKEVARWLRGEAVDIHYQGVQTTVTPIKIGPVTLQTELELTHYVEQGNEWFQYLMEDRQGYDLLLDWLSRCQNIQSKRLFDRLMRIAAPKGVEFAREALLRYFRPERPVRVLSDFEVFTTDDPAGVARAFVSELEDHWKITSPNEMSLYLFSFGMALEQRVKESAGDEKGRTCEEILLKLIDAFKQPAAEQETESSEGPQASGDTAGRKKKGRTRKKERAEPPPGKTDMEAPGEWDFLSIDVTDRGIMTLFHSFNPDRVFRDLTGKNYATQEDVGLFFAAQPEHWDNRFLKEERTAFLHKCGFGRLTGLDREAFLLKVFEEQALYEIEVSNFQEPDGARGAAVEVKYLVYRTLRPFLEQQGIAQNIREKVESGSTTIRKFLKIDERELNVRLLRSIDKHGRFPPDRWTQDSLDRLRGKLVDYKKNLQDQDRKRKRQQMASDAVYAIKSFLFLLAPLLLFFFAMAFLEKDHRLVNLFTRYSPFEIAFDEPFVVDADDPLMPRWQTGLGVLWFITIVLLPSCFLWDRQRWLGFGSLLFSYLVFGWAVILFPLPVAALYLIMVPILQYASDLNRLRLLPFLASLVPVLFIAWSGYMHYRPVPPSRQVAKPLNFLASTPSRRAAVRTGPSPEHAAVGVVGYRDTVRVVQAISNWYLVRFSDVEGYVPSETFVRVPIHEGRIKKRNPYIMSAPTYDTTTVRTVVKGERVSILASDGDWYLVRLPDQTQGYLHQKDVEIIDK
jgi:serine/threonine protein kinase